MIFPAKPIVLASQTCFWQPWRNRPPNKQKNASTATFQNLIEVTVHFRLISDRCLCNSWPMGQCTL